MLVQELARQRKGLAGTRVLWGNESCGDQALERGGVEEGCFLLHMVGVAHGHIFLDLGSWRRVD